MSIDQVMDALGLVLGVGLYVLAAGVGIVGLVLIGQGIRWAWKLKP